MKEETKKIGLKMKDAQNRVIYQYGVQRIVEGMR